MFKKILIANRGEIALRIIRACREMGIATVAVYSTADEDSLHVKLADESVCIGPPQSKYSYLNIAAIMSAADLAGVDAIHPGYGFLSENENFAKIAEQCGIKFIGPKSIHIEKMGDKAVARSIAKKAKVPMLQGTDVLNSVQEAEKAAEEIGFPVMLKAVAGGGGRGIQIIREKSELKNAFEKIRSEAKAAFGVPDCYMEKFCERPRHVEIQVVCDEYGNMVYLGERDCTVQRRHQKLIEESPSPVMNNELRKKMGEAALRLCQEVGYHNVGTVEFLVDQNQNFYFMEMNTRIQVEHPVTEMVTGIDLIKTQIKIAAGNKLEFKQEDIKINGHSIEVRINAEDPEKQIPSPGLITFYHEPGGNGVRVDSFVYQNYKVKPYYDSMIAKLIVHAETRDKAIQKAASALQEYLIEGIKTNIAFQRKILLHPLFKSAQFDTNFIAHFTQK
jgi:acetyl-CoA carboxylase biotin carboxylase subunit